MMEPAEAGCERPLVYLVTDAADRVVERHDWLRIAVLDPAVSADATDRLPRAILVDIDAPPAPLIERIRARDDVLADASLFVIGSRAAQAMYWSTKGADLVLSDWPDSAVLDDWTMPRNIVVPRLIAHFGEDSIVPLLTRFRTALRALEGVLDDAALHRLAGHAGTLGYADLTAACYFARVEPRNQDAVRREVRKAIYDLSRLLTR